jgi:hypothetical protein
MLRTIAILLAATVSAGAQIGQSFPHTNKYGRATIEYRHEGLGVVANYDYSQKNHSSPWLLIDVALGSADRFVLHRTNFKLVTPDGQTIPLASQQQGPSRYGKHQPADSEREDPPAEPRLLLPAARPARGIQLLLASLRTQHLGRGHRR